MLTVFKSENATCCCHGSPADLDPLCERQNTAQSSGDDCISPVGMILNACLIAMLNDGPGQNGSWSCGLSIGCSIMVAGRRVGGPLVVQSVIK